MKLVPPISGMVVLVPPGCDVRAELKAVMQRNGYTNYEELEPKAGCRRFVLTNKD